MDRSLPPLQSLVYDEDGVPMRVVGVKDGIATLVYEGGVDRAFYRFMGVDDLYQALTEPYPDGTYDVVIEVHATRTVRVSANQLPALCVNMVPGTDTPPIPYGDYMINSIRPVRIVEYSG
jgi:adenosine/AMP kinase